VVRLSSREYDDVRSPLISRTRFGRTAAGLSLAAALVAGGAATATTATAADNPFQRGPDPSAASVDATRGTFATSQQTITGQRGFGGGIVYFPTDTSQGTFGAVAISPGFTARWSSLSWLGPRLASFGFVVVGIETNSTLDQPASRGTQLLAALDWAVNTSSVRTRIDRNRLAVAGHSMGGGGTLAAANSRPSLQAAIGLAPWNTQKSWTGIRVPTLILGGEADTVAPVAQHSEPFYNSMSAAPEKAYLEINNEDHFFPNDANNLTARMMVSWLKAFVDNDTRYVQFLCAGPTGTAVQEYRNTCPLTV
jgi:predicted dienelactone hydrolase